MQIDVLRPSRIVVAAMLVGTLAIVHPAHLDGLDGLVFQAAGLADGSERAAEDSAAGFGRIPEGMNAHEVRALAGERNT